MDENDRCLLPEGTYVRVTEPKLAGGHTYIGKVDGYDIFRSKYRIAARYAGWNQWHFLTPGCQWAFPGWVQEISEQEALAIPRD